MKRVILFVLSCSLITTIYSQKIVKEHYTVSGGLLGGANFSEFRITENNPTGIDYNTKIGWSAGGWINFPISKAFSIEPQLMYSSYTYRASTTTTLLLNDGKIRYASVPLLFKFHAGDKFAITAGPQVDFVSSVEDKNNLAQRDDIKKTSFSAFGGIEVFPHGRVTFFGRYIHGLSNMDARGSEAGAMQYKNQNIQAGLKIKLFGKKVPGDSDGDGISDPNDKCPNQVGTAKYDGCPIPDTDGDGINDELDRCPTQAGTAKYNGCPIPDTDGDGINDENDKCINQAGTAKYNGCPIPDTDGDGVNDENDRCPNEAGPASRNGCPATDSDKDGVNDDEDRCPDVPGSRTNNGCPDVPANVSKTIGTAAQNITFGANNAKLTTKSTASLNQLVAVMKENPTLKVKIEGHTSNAGNETTNMTVSENRAAAVKTYLVSKGISEDRITVEGFGGTTPISDNSSAAGRTKNNRVEIRIVY
ncbi:MAG: OmpA family protein [Chitinophagaceae bacterium]|nr:OmpA family protein [Chitinophagaceae bacterium]